MAVEAVEALSLCEEWEQITSPLSLQDSQNELPVDCPEAHLSQSPFERCSGQLH